MILGQVFSCNSINRTTWAAQNSNSPWAESSVRAFCWACLNRRMAWLISLAVLHFPIAFSFRVSGMDTVIVVLPSVIEPVQFTGTVMIRHDPSGIS